jgi:endonuclease/exonuclease/phosphatase (EEP) superfamily protein YafD
MSILQIIWLFLFFLAAVSVLFPLIKKDFWIFRVGDYPRVQKLAFQLFLIGSWFFVFSNNLSWWHYAPLIFLIWSCFHLIYLILPFTIFGKIMVKKSTQKQSSSISFLVSNVFQDNQKYDKLAHLIKSTNPDVIFLLETNLKWKEALSEATKEYKFKIEMPLENTYGLLFYSKHEIIKQEINYLIDEEIPSIVADIAWENEIIRIFGLHPTPPVPTQNKFSTDRDAEILIIAKKAKECDLPCVVMGDLNDVAWSYTTKLFLKTSGLLDPRRGRGMFSTFNAKHVLFRWPLDHYFVSAHFRLVDMKVENSINSDHFPISIRLQIASEDTTNQLQIDKDEKREAEEKIEAGKTDNPQ